MSEMRLAFLEDVRITSAPEQLSELSFASGGEGVWGLRLSFKPLTPGLREAILALQGDGATASSLAPKIMATDGFQGLGRFRSMQRALEDHGFLKYRLMLPGEGHERPFATLRPVSSPFRYEATLGADARCVMSRFAYVRRGDAGELLLTAPTAHAIATLHDPAAMEIVARLGRPQTAAELAQSTGLSEDAVLGFLNCAANAGGVVALGTDGIAHEDNDPALAQWAFHDLLFHAGSRLGRRSSAFGATMRHAQRFQAPPVVKPPMSSEIIPLFKPDLEKLAKEGPSFAEVQEKRRTVREYDPKPITVDQLGEFLYRSARVKKLVSEGGVSWRPSAGGGAIHELEVYAAVGNCEGLPNGLYHYDPLNHNLEKISTEKRPEEFHRLLQLGTLIGVLEQPAQVFFIITARFQRLQNKYEGVAYSLVLKDVGCLYQTMYLTAEAMGLAGCALGGGDSDLFPRIAGLEYYYETSVGEFLLGSGPTPRSEPLAQPKAVSDGRARWT